MAEIKDSNVHIYLVDDDDFYLKVFENKFKSAATYIVHTFNSGEALIDYISRKPVNKKHIHIVVLDYYLKSMENQDAKNGIEILKQLHEIDPGIYVLLYSGIEDDSIVSKGLQLGALVFVKKNENTFTRIHNSVKKIISKTNLEIKQKQSKLTKRIFIITIIASIAIVGLVYLIYPELF